MARLDVLDPAGAPGYRYLTTPHPVAGLTPEQGSAAGACRSAASGGP